MGDFSCFFEMAAHDCRNESNHACPDQCRIGAGDLLMTTVLCGLEHTELVERCPRLAAYRDRCMARSAFDKAIADQLRSFEGNGPEDQPKG